MDCHRCQSSMQSVGSTFSWYEPIVENLFSLNRVFIKFHILAARNVTGISTDGALIALSGLNCTGNETKLADCPHLGYGNHDCQPKQAAGLYCGCKAFFLV